MRNLKKQHIKTYVLVGLFLLISGTVLVQCAGISKIPGLDEMLKKEPPVTVSLSDAVTEIPFLDDYNPERELPIYVLPRTREGAFVLERPGNYTFESQSYCLGAGKYSPGEGDGYLYAPLRGSQADIVRNILQKSFLHPEIAQEDIQVLFWAIMSRTKLSNMSPQMQSTAERLLTRKEILELNGGALGVIPEELLENAIERLPAEVRQVSAAQAKLRSMLTEAHASYEELERVAVRFGDAPPGEGSRIVPLGRWSYQPDGYFIRYFPDGYSRTFIELYVPENFKIERDQYSRITSIADDNGIIVQTDYDDVIKPLIVPGEPDLKAYHFRSIHFAYPDPTNPETILRTEWSGVGWTFVGVPLGEDNINNIPDSFPGLRTRYQWAKKHKNEFDALEEGMKAIQGRSSLSGVPVKSVDQIMALGHYSIALQEAIKSSGTDKGYLVVDPINLVKRAWQSSVAAYMTVYKQQSATEERHARLYENNDPVVDKTFSKKAMSVLALNDYDDSFIVNDAQLGIYILSNESEASDRSSSFNPASGTATPGNTARQILAQSSKGAKPPKKPDWMDQEVWDDQDECHKRCIESCEKYHRKEEPLPGKKTLWEKCIDDCFDNCGVPVG